jgi:23S rRNA (guanosine2251-2'-O)-methyltransferase
VQAVRELLIVGSRRVHELLLAPDRETGRLGPALDDIAQLAAGARVAVQVVGRAKLLAQARTDAPQGVLARAEPLAEHELATLATTADRSGSPPFLLAADGVTDPGNLGALLRSAECAGVSGVVLPRHRAAHVTPAVAKAAAGAIEHLPMAVVAGLPSALEDLRKLGVWVIGLDSGGATPIADLGVADQPVCLVVGAEGRGLSPLVRRRCDVVASIPLRGRLPALNVAVAGAIACFEVARQRHRQTGSKR